MKDISIEDSDTKNSEPGYLGLVPVSDSHFKPPRDEVKIMTSVNRSQMPSTHLN